ncbi:MAG: hypothetical protein J1F03_08380 [Oscillospiraceae bacterium]|nr:hypothetical protein [Oscillospiraceae bacterium]
MNETQNNDYNVNDQTYEGGVVTENAVQSEINAISSQTTELDQKEKQLLDALDEILEKRSKKYMNSESLKRPLSSSERLAKGIVRKGVGIISLALVLILFGIVMICCLFSPAPDYLLPLKFSPVAAILLGIEIIVTLLITHGHLKINLISVIISAILVGGCCTMGVVLNRSYNMDKIEYNNRTIAAEIYDRSYKELRYLADIETMSIEVDLNPDGTGVTKGIDALSAGDRVVINVEFGGVYASPKTFAADCKKIIDGFRIMGIDITDFHFANQSSFHSYKLDITGKYLQDYPESRLSELVTHIYIEDTDYLEDLEDLENSEDLTNSD